MPAFSQKVRQIRRSVGLYWLPQLILCTASFAIFSCNEPKIEESARTEPWKKESAELPASQTSKKQEFQVAQGGLLRFALPGRKARPEGTIGGISGNIFVDLNALQFITGEIRFDLRELRVSAESSHAPDKTKKISSPPNEQSPPPSHNGTQLAQQWLGLGAHAPHHERNRYATFVIESARDLSHANAFSGALRKGDENSAATGNSKAPGEIRQVHLTAVGQLKIRGLAVDRHLALTVQFHFGEPAGRGRVPEKIRVTLRGTTHVPLSEYEISPRDEAGHLITEQLALLGPVIGSTAAINGTLELLPNN